jgi:hypothetical protein
MWKSNSRLACPSRLDASLLAGVWTLRGSTTTLRARRPEVSSAWTVLEAATASPKDPRKYPTTSYWKPPIVFGSAAAIREVNELI